MSKKQKEIGGIVYSTNPNYSVQKSNEEEDLKPIKDQKVRVHKETKGRGGKVASLVTGITGNEDTLKRISKRLKQALGVGGSVKEGEIIIQGDHSEQIIALLIQWGYSQTKKG